MEEEALVFQLVNSKIKLEFGKEKMGYEIREISKVEYRLLEDFIYEVISIELFR